VIDAINMILGTGYPTAVTAAATKTHLEGAEVPETTNLAIEYGDEVLAVRASCHPFGDGPELIVEIERALDVRLELGSVSDRDAQGHVLPEQLSDLLAGRLGQVAGLEVGPADRVRFLQDQPASRVEAIYATPIVTASRKAMRGRGSNPRARPRLLLAGQRTATSARCEATRNSERDERDDDEEPADDSWSSGCWPVTAVVLRWPGGARRVAGQQQRRCSTAVVGCSVRPLRQMTPSVEQIDGPTTSAPRHSSRPGGGARRPALLSRWLERRKGMEELRERSLDELGPVDYLVVEFAGQQNFTGEAAAELLRLHDADHPGRTDHHARPTMARSCPGA
jgi:hypothetical protein